MMKEKEMKRVPKLRFPEFTDDWEQRKLGELVDVCSGRDYKHLSEGAIPVYGTGGYMLSVNDALSYDRDAIGIGRKGTIDKPYILRAPFWTVDTLFYAIPREKVDLNFAFDIFQKIDWKKKDESTGVPSLSKTAINDIDVFAPKHDEQHTIGHFFEAIDHLITLHQRKLEKLKELRKGVMKKLFNQEVRFKADDESEFPEWEKKKIGDVFSQIKDKNKDGRNQNVITNSAEFGLINQRDFFDKDIAVDGKTENYTVIKTGDFVYNPRKSKQAPYGPFNCYQLEENGIVSPLYTCLRPKSNVNDKYLLWYFKSGSWYRFIYENGAQNGARHDRVGMTDSLMQEIPVYLPQAVEEQQKIADCLSTLDDVIEKQKATLAAWEELKKGLLQQMFV